MPKPGFNESVSNLVYLKSTQYASLIGEGHSASRLPTVPQAGFIKLYTICNFGGQVVDTITHVQDYVGRSGLTLGTEPNNQTDYEGNVLVTSTTIRISAGSITQQTANQPSTGVETTIFNARSISGTTTPTNKRWT